MRARTNEAPRAQRSDYMRDHTQAQAMLINVRLSPHARLTHVHVHGNPFWVWGIENDGRMVWLLWMILCAT